ncbi:MAG: hypothetical protein HFE63_07380 [Clostridiales bacterium]|nr:hypothetical protein [Clostridiales bacterium]
MKRINTIIIGATALACPLAASLGGECIVVERGFAAGAEFSSAMDASRLKTQELSKYSADILAELKERRIADDSGNVHILAVGGVLASRYLDSGCKLLLGASVMSVESTSDGLLTTIFTPEEGYTQYLAANVIDTNVHDFMGYTKTFGVLLALDSSLAEFNDGEVFMQKGRFDDEYILRFRVARDTTIPEAEKLADEWMAANKAKLGTSKAAGIALEFGYEFESTIDIMRGGVRYIPSAAYGDVMSAIEGGTAVCL